MLANSWTKEEDIIRFESMPYEYCTHHSWFLLISHISRFITGSLRVASNFPVHFSNRHAMIIAEALWGKSSRDHVDRSNVIEENQGLNVNFYNYRTTVGSWKLIRNIMLNLKSRGRAYLHTNAVPVIIVRVSDRYFQPG